MPLLSLPGVGLQQGIEGDFMMNDTGGWESGQMLIWAALAILVVVVVVIKSLIRKK